MDCSIPGFSVIHYFPELAQTHVRWVGDATQPSHPLSSPSPALSLSQHQALFQWVSSSHHVAKVLELQLSISLSNESSALISFRINWFDLLVVQGSLKSLFQQHSSKASILWRSAFFIVQLSYPYMSTGKTIALTIWTFVSKMRSLLLKTLFSINKCYAPPYPLCHQTSEFQNKLQTKEFWSGLYAFLQWVISMLEMS